MPRESRLRRLSDLANTLDAVAGVKQFAPPFKISEHPFAARHGAPAAGEHSAEILGEAGFSAGEIAALRAQQVI